MSLDGNVRRRPDLWSYISFSSSNSRRGSLSLPLSSQRRSISNDDGLGQPGSSRHTYSYSTASESYPSIHNNRRSRLLKYGLGLFVVLSLLYFFGAGGKAKAYLPGRGQTAAVPAAQTTKCTKSYDSSKPLIQYALMVDAGSTGSRIHVYKFNNCGPSPDLDKELLFKQTPKREGGSGLSSYDSDAEGAARSLDLLLDAAMDIVPKEYRSCSPIAVKATAGLRKLGTEKSNRILAAVRQRLDTQYPFPLIDDAHNGVEVMDGTDEGVYAWITANYLLGKIGGADKSPTAAVFDLGGGSTQIVFEPTFPAAPNGGMPEKLAEGDHKYELAFGGRDFTLYQHSYLGFGLMEARKSLHNLIVDQASANHESSDRSWLRNDLVNPCLAPGTSKVVDVSLKSGVTVAVNMTGPASGSAAQCRGFAEKTLRKDKSCKLSPCAFDGVHQPPLAKTFAREDIYLFSYFYDRTKPLGMPDSFTLNELKALTHKVCDGEASWDVFASVEGALDELRDRPDHCLDLNFMLALLHTGYEMPMDREVRIAKKLKDNELGWCLGASLPLLNKESGWQCKVQQVA